MHSLGAITLLVTPTELTLMTNVKDGLHSSPIAKFPIRDVGAEFHDDACAFVAWGPHAEMRHGGRAEVVEHEVDVAEADAGCV